MSGTNPPPTPTIHTWWPALLAFDLLRVNESQHKGWVRVRVRVKVRDRVRAGVKVKVRVRLRVRVRV